MIAIVGGGLAGTVLANLLYKKKIEFHWYHDRKPSASHISSGIFNPITGRKYALSWNYEACVRTAIDFYGVHLKSVAITKQFIPYNDTITAQEVVQANETYLRLIDENWIEVRRCYQLDVSGYIEETIAILQTAQIPTYSSFEHHVLRTNGKTWIYQDIHYDKILFAEGIKAVENPYFQDVSFIPNRGEALYIDVENFQLNTVKKVKKFICHFRGKFWIGSSFDRVDITAPIHTQEQYDRLRHAIPELIDHHNFEILEHLGALRSTTLDRRPIVGESPRHPNLFMFNGFGTKGASLIPYCAIELWNLIHDCKPLDSEISIDRFKKRMRL